jgi:hypothetical protein
MRTLLGAAIFLVGLAYVIAGSDREGCACMLGAVLLFAL